MFFSVDISYNFVSIVDLLGVVQGLILGSIVLFANKKQQKPTLFLGLFILTYSLELVPAILDDLSITQQYPQYQLLPFHFSWLLFPLFHYYVKAISIFANQPNNYRLLIPGIIVFIIETFIFLQPLSSKAAISESWWYLFMILGGIFYSIGVAFYTLKYINKHLIELKNQYASIEYKTLYWTRIFLLIGIVYTVITFFALFVDTPYYFKSITTVINVMLLYWISIKGLIQYNVPMVVPVVIEDTPPYVTALPTNSPNNASNEENENLSTLVHQLEDHLNQHQIFTKTDLTIADLAQQLDVHPKLISKAINSQLNQNFNSYINNFRIEKAKQLLTSDLAQQWSIEGISREVGFRSKSTFYQAFKKSTGLTPSRYKNQ